MSSDLLLMGFGFFLTIGAPALLVILFVAGNMLGKRGSAEV